VTVVGPTELLFLAKPLENHFLDLNIKKMNFEVGE